ncbi:MAG: class I SAM-dependent methyltransferase [Armatimonadota bacterium]|nr:class I SAM-dependent methyltransferase [Armatimonadota bacterium]MCX7776517.1 class I SAM-dependent methyltransferase [Armatimonadota bacterium]MDW8024314.1 class I SAM-dependent methyltransferase [Armatimonadota bacterium]
MEAHSAPCRRDVRLQACEGHTRRVARASCPWCSSKELHPLIIDDGVPVVECGCCGIAYALTVPTLQGIRDYYTEQFADERHWESELSSARPWLHRRLLARIAKYKPGGTLLDIGCSFGFFINMARQIGYDVIGVEISEPAANYARRQFGLKVFSGTLEEASLEGESVDVVTLIDVLEHVPEPLITLNEVKRVLRSGGLLVIRVPNFKFHWLKTLLLRVLKRGNFIGLDSRNHVNHFTVNALMDGLNRLGFKVIEVRPGAPNIYRRWLFDSLRIAYWAMATALSMMLGIQIGNSIEAFAFKR